MPYKLVIEGEIGWDIYASGVRKQLEEAGGQEVDAEISTPGGFVGEGVTIGNILKKYNDETAKINLTIMGLAASMGSYLMMSVPVEQRKAYNDTMFMIHNPWSFAIGDYKEMKEEAEFLELMTDHIARKYHENDNFSLDEIRALMDKTTYFMGNEMLEAGFVGEILGGDRDSEKDRGELLAIAKAKVKDLHARMEKSEKAKSDIRRAAAMISKFSINLNSNRKTEIKPQNKLTRNSEKEEKKTMPKLSEFLAQNPDAKAEYDSDIIKAKTDGVEAGKKEIQARVDKVLPFLANENYPGISPLAKKVLSGESTVDSLEGAVAAFDMMTAKKKTDDAVDDSDKTPDINQGGNIPLSTDGIIRNEADAKAFADRTKGKGVA